MFIDQSLTTSWILGVSTQEVSILLLLYYMYMFNISVRLLLFHHFMRECWIEGLNGQTFDSHNNITHLTFR